MKPIKVTLVQSEVNTLITALKILRSQQEVVAQSLKGVLNEGQVGYGMMLVDALREKLENAALANPRRKVGV